MEESIKQFAKSTENLSKNPLGIIGLFILLVYAIVGLVFSKNIFEPYERFILICFMVGFPILVLIVFYKLVTKHHNKLYAPRDYRQENNFLRMAGINSEKMKVENEKEVKQDDSIVIKEVIKNIEQIQKQLNDMNTEIQAISGNKEMKIQQLGKQLMESQKLLDSTKVYVEDYAKYKIHINDLLPTYSKILERLEQEKIKISGNFGSTSLKRTVPTRFLLTVGEDVSIKYIKFLITILSEFGLDSIRYNKKPDARNKIYIGAYGYESLPISILNDNVKDIIFSENLTDEKIKNRIKRESKKIL